MANILIAGCGDVGSATGQRLAAEGHRVWGLRRKVEELPPVIQPVAADLTHPETLQAVPAGLDCVVYAAAADGASDTAYQAAYVDGLRNLLDVLTVQRQTLGRIIFTSSTGVYAQSGGEWVDEASPTEPVSFAGQRMLEAERVLLSSAFPATIVRLGGIYGSGRTRLIRQVRQGGAVCSDGPPVYTNRIHRDDCANVVCHLLSLSQPDSLYLGVDHDPADQAEVFRWLAARLGVPLQRVEPASYRAPHAHDGRAKRSNKRCRNTKLLESGYVFQYPSFREGYAAILAEEENRHTARVD